MIQNSPKRVSETLYFIVSVNFAFIELNDLNLWKSMLRIPVFLQSQESERNER